MSTKFRLASGRWPFAFRSTKTYNSFLGNIKITKNVDTMEFGD